MLCLESLARIIVQVLEVILAGGLTLSASAGDPQPEGWIKVNVEASWRQCVKSASLGSIMRNHHSTSLWLRIALSYWQNTWL